MSAGPQVIANSFITQIGEAQYVSFKYADRLSEAGIEPSVGSVGDSFDNALAETINGLYKAEVIHRCGPYPKFLSLAAKVLEKRVFDRTTRHEGMKVIRSCASA